MRNLKVLQIFGLHGGGLSVNQNVLFALREDGKLFMKDLGPPVSKNNWEEVSDVPDDEPIEMEVEMEHVTFTDQESI
jgi:hypothetical protein